MARAHQVPGGHARTLLSGREQFNQQVHRIDPPGGRTDVGIRRRYRKRPGPLPGGRRCISLEGKENDSRKSSSTRSPRWSRGTSKEYGFNLGIGRQGRIPGLERAVISRFEWGIVGIIGTRGTWMSQHFAIPALESRGAGFIPSSRSRRRCCGSLESTCAWVRELGGACIISCLCASLNETREVTIRAGRREALSDKDPPGRRTRRKATGAPHPAHDSRPGKCGGTARWGRNPEGLRSKRPRHKDDWRSRGSFGCTRRAKTC